MKVVNLTGFTVFECYYFMFVWVVRGKLDSGIGTCRCTEENNIINYLDITIHRNNNNIDISPTEESKIRTTPLEI